MSLKALALPLGLLVPSIAAHAAPYETDAPLEELVVTATQRATTLSDLAGNTATFDAPNLKTFSQVTDILNTLPGINIQPGNGQEHLTAIRSPVLIGGAGAGSFLYLEDGVPLRSPGFANVNGLFEAHAEQAGRIEVVRGPGSALYGSNAVHGLINVLSPDPFAAPILTESLSYGSHEAVVNKFQLGFKQGGGAGLLALTLKHDDGWRASSGYDEQKASVHAKWGNGNNAFAFTGAFTNLNQETAGYIGGFEAYKDETLARANANPEAYRNARSLRMQLRWDRDLGDGLGLSLTPYLRKTDMNLIMHFLPGGSIEENGHKSLGLQGKLYKDFDAGHLIVAGLDLEHTEGFLTETQPGPTVFSFVTGDHYDYSVNADLVSPFVRSEWQLGEKTRLTAGVRLDYTVYDYNNHLPANTVGRFQRTANRRDTFTTATPKLGLTHQVSDALSLFGLYARGQRAPQTTDLYRLQVNQGVGDAEPETLDSLELGLRDTKGPLTFELSAYVMKKEHYFFRDSDGYNVSDGETLHRGVELSFAATPRPTVDVAGSLTYAIHTYEFDNLVAANSTEDIRKGNDVDTAPRFLANVRIGWTPREDWRAELEYHHMDNYYVDGANAHDYDGHDLLHLRVKWQANEIISIAGQIRNLTDEAYADRADYAFGSYRYFPGESRNYSLTLSARF